MITLNDYLYSGDTVLKILQNYIEDLRKDAKKNHNEIDLIHCNFLIQIKELLEHNDFLTAQSQKIREFYKYMTKEYPFLAFTVKGRIKSLIRAEEKFNGYIVEYIYDYYSKHGTYPPIAELKNRLSCFRDLIAYRIVISLPKCHLAPGQDRGTEELKYLYDIANKLPGFLEERGFTAEPANGVKLSHSRYWMTSRNHITETIFQRKKSPIISPYISHFMITAPALSLKCRSGQKIWMMWQKSARQTIWDMKKNRKANAQEETQSHRERASISTKPTKEECAC